MAEVAAVVAAEVVAVLLVVVIVEKQFSLTQPCVVLFSDSGLYQNPESRRTCAVPRRALFSILTLLILFSIWASQSGKLSAIALSA